MSPEERVQAAFEAAEKDPNHRLAPVSIEAMYLAAAIRAAENDALERAVGVLVGCWCDEYGGMTREEAEATSEVVLIRSLKSKEGER